MTTVMNPERESLEVGALPEYVRENKARTRGTLEFVSNKPQLPSKLRRLQLMSRKVPQTDILEALWPGVHHDFHQPVRRTPSFYLTVGFMVGAALALVVVWLYSLVPPLIANFSKATANTNVAQNTKSADTTPVSTTPDTIVPGAPTYEVQSGDTLAGIALKNYKRFSPRCSMKFAGQII